MTANNYTLTLYTKPVPVTDNIIYPQTSPTYNNMTDSAYQQQTKRSKLILHTQTSRKYLFDELI